MLLLPLLASLTTPALAQTPSVCSNTPQSGQRVLCQHRESTITDDIEINLQNQAITVTGDDEHAVTLGHNGPGDIVFTMTDTQLSTEGAYSSGISADSPAEFYGPPLGAGGITLNLSGGSIKTQGQYGYGVAANNQGDANDAGGLDLTISGTSIETNGDSASGLFLVQQQGPGDLHLRMNNGARITTTGSVLGGTGSLGIYAQNTAPDSDTVLDLSDISIETQGDGGRGIYIWHHRTGSGDINATLSGASIETKRSGSYGLSADSRGTGDIGFTITDTRIATEDDLSYGIFSRVTGPGSIDIAVTGGGIETKGAQAHGVYAYPFVATAEEIRVSLEGGSIVAAGDAASAIRIGWVSDQAVFAAGFGEDGYRRQTAIVNGRAFGEAAGVELIGGGTVEIGPQGTVGAKSGVAVLATGGEAPPLRVRMTLDNRPVADIIGDGWIINDGGGTEIVVNGVTLHDRAEGATGRTVSYGVWDVNLRLDGLQVVDRTDPEQFVLGERKEGLIAGRDFSAADFVRGYAPRSAVYEALTGALFRLDAQGLWLEDPAGSDVPLWIRLSGGDGSFEPNHATVGAKYDFDRFSAEAGLNVPLGEEVTGFLSVRGVEGDAEIDGPNGGGEIAADGVGATVGAIWTGAETYYARGHFSYTDYDVDLSSDSRGTLRKEVDADSQILDLEAGWRMGRYGAWDLTPRIWLTYARVDVDDFTDALGVRVSMDEETRFTGGLGLVGEMQYPMENGELVLRALVDLEHTISGSRTDLEVLGTRLSSEATETRLLLGFGGTWQRGDGLTMETGIAAEGPDSDDEFYSVHFRLGWKY